MGRLLFGATAGVYWMGMTVCVVTDPGFKRVVCSSSLFVFPSLVIFWIVDVLLAVAIHH
jgi:hypothetical protein